MKRIFFLFFLCCMTTLATFAQEKKAYTLEDVIPGGNNYFNLVPENIPGLQWWGDVCVRADVENIRSIQLKDGKESILVTLEEVNQAIEKGEKPYQLSHELKPLRSLMSASLPWAERKVIVFQQNSYWVEYDFRQKKITNISRLNEKATNLDFCKTNDKVAYTVGNGLFVTGKGEESHQINPSQTEEGVVYGQAVHRNEFGIYKGTFWSPKGSYLAFYRMDQSMVTDYPQVNTSTRIATLEPDKYPMAGMTSHKVTVGVYDVKTEKVIYLQAGDPTDRYFTNVSWSPDEQHIYVIELNRDQNHAQLVCYQAATGEKEGVLYEEKNPKYVEPQHPLVFLPWDESKFIYQSQRDGFNHIYLPESTRRFQPPVSDGYEGKRRRYMEKWQTGRQYLSGTPESNSFDARRLAGAGYSWIQCRKEGNYYRQHRNFSAANQSVQPQRQNWKAYITRRKRRYAPGFSL